MLIKYNELFTQKKLKIVSKINGLKFVNKLNKSQLLFKLNNHKTASYIQRCFRRRLMKNDICPISHEKLVYPFVSIKTGNFFFYYDFLTLVNYLNKSGNFQDPCTRTEITDKKLTEINKLILYYYGPNTTKIIVSPTMQLDIQLNIIIYCMYDIITELNNVSISSDIELYSNILPRIIYYCRFLINNHPKEHCNMIINACIQSISGKTNISSIIINYLTGLLRT